MNKTAMKLAEIFNNNRDNRICVLGTTCCGKTTLKKEFAEAADMDDVLWPTLSEREEAYICKKPWTADIGVFTSELVKARVKIEPGRPLFFLILLECELIVYLDISDELLKKHCEKRKASFQDAKNIKFAIEKRLEADRGDRKVEVVRIDT